VGVRLFSSVTSMRVTGYLSFHRVGRCQDMPLQKVPLAWVFLREILLSGESRLRRRSASRWMPFAFFPGDSRYVFTPRFRDLKGEPQIILWVFLSLLLAQALAFGPPGVLPRVRSNDLRISRGQGKLSWLDGILPVSVTVARSPKASLDVPNPYLTWSHLWKRFLEEKGQVHHVDIYPCVLPTKHPFVPIFSYFRCQSEDAAKVFFSLESDDLAGSIRAGPRLCYSSLLDSFPASLAPLPLSQDIYHHVRSLGDFWRESYGLPPFTSPCPP